MVSIADAEQTLQRTAMRAHERLRPICVICVLLICLLALREARACANATDGRPLLGARQVAGAASAQLVRIQQRDVDLIVLVQRAAGAELHDSPGGRNAIEWLYLAPESGKVQLCFYSALRQRYADPLSLVQVTVSDLSGASPQQHAALQGMDRAGAYWARRTFDDRRVAAQQYASVASKADAAFDVADYAQLYAALANQATMDYGAAKHGFDALAARTGAPAYVRYMTLWSQGLMRKPKHGIQALQAASAITKRLGLRRDHLDISNRLGELHILSGELQRGEQYIRGALRLVKDDRQLVGHLRNNLGLFYLQRSESDASPAAAAADLLRSLQEHLEALEQLTQVDDRDKLWIVENNIAIVALALGDLSNANLHYRAALRLVDGALLPLGKGVVYDALGQVHLDLGDYQAAEGFTKMALQIAQQWEPSYAMRLQCRLGTVQQLQGMLSVAMGNHRKCFEAALQLRNPLLQAEALRQLAEDYRRAGKTGDAWWPVEQARVLLGRVSNREVRVKVLASHALLAQQRGATELARREVQQAIAVAKQEKSMAPRVVAFVAAMSIFADQHRTQAAIEYGRNAIDAIETVHESLDKESLGPAWSAQNEVVYAKLVGILLHDYQRHRDPTRLALAFEIVERSEAIGLRQQFGIPRADLQRVAESSIVRNLSELANEQASAATPSLSLSYRHQHDLLTLARLSGVNVPVPPPLSLNELRESLGEHQAALSYFFTDDALWLFYLTRAQREPQLFKLAAKSAVEHRIERVAKSVEIPQQMQSAMHELAQLLLPQAIRNTDAEWLIVPYGSLNSVPFAALPVKVSGGDQPVLVRHLIKIAPSLSAHFMSKRARAQDFPLDLAVFADPAYSRPRSEDVRGQSPDVWTRNLEPLKETAREWQNLQAHFAPSRAKVFTGTNATRVNLRRAEVRRAAILHIATHGYFRSTDPDNVGFALAESIDADGIDSGFVTLSELFTQSFDNELVVISGCNSGAGAQRGGEGLNSLTRGFIAQGVSHVVSTLWEVPDAVAADFMALFYDELTQHHSVARALQAAQLRLRDQHPEPYFWAPYQLTTVSANDLMQLTSFGTSPSAATLARKVVAAVPRHY